MIKIIAIKEKKALQKMLTIRESSIRKVNKKIPMLINENIIENIFLISSFSVSNNDK